MKFCSACGGPIALQTPEGDNRERACCTACGMVHYVNPKIVVGTIPIYQDKVLLCRRAIEPRHGFWTLPAGFMELNETTLEGAVRETFEEAGAQVELGPLFTVLDVLHAGQVHMFYRAHMPTPHMDAGTESLEVGLFAEADIPWADLAFRTVSHTLELFFADRKQGHFGLHTGHLEQPTHWQAQHFKGDVFKADVFKAPQAQHGPS